MEEIELRTGDRLTAAEVYRIWAIRDAVFSVEQRCTVPDVDGIDLRSDCTHVWVTDDDGVASYLRSYVDADGVRHVGRVCTRADRRGEGLSGRLIDAVHEQWGREVILLGAQSHLEGWYGSRGYVTVGPHYDDAGIDHVPMRRDPA